jgi:mRNA-degrading endonuclease RelE of RelBE toxin-antitoxin system
MKFEFKPSFDHSIKRLPKGDQEEIKRVAISTIDILSHQKELPQGLGLKRLKENYWETRKGLQARILFKWEGSLVQFILSGDHEDIKRFLKNC